MPNRIEKTFCKGEVIVKEGQEGNTFFVILEGTVEVLKRRDGKDVVVNVLGPGEFFGEMSLIDPGYAKRSATVRTMEETRVAIMGRDDFEQYLGKLSPGVRNLLIRLASRLRKTTAQVEAQRRQIDSELPETLDYTMTLDELEKAREHSVDVNFMRKKFRKGQLILREGDRGQCGFIVREGRLEVSRRTSEGKVVLGVLEENDVLGEKAMFEDSRRSATVIAQTDGELIVFGKRDMINMARQSPLEIYMILDSLASKLDRTNQAYSDTLVELNRSRDKAAGLEKEKRELAAENDELRKRIAQLKSARSADSGGGDVSD